MNKVEYTIEDNRIRFIDYYSGAQDWMSFDFDFYHVTPGHVRKYLDSLEAHVTYVREAGEQLGVDPRQLREHDNSKFSIEEFPYYVRNFHGDKGDPDGFARAWLHHIHNNPHHWQHWIFPDGFAPKGSNVINGVVEMPKRYALEMVADWMGASMAYTGSWDMTDWLLKNTPKIKVHPETAYYLTTQILDPMGYREYCNFNCGD